MKLAIALLASLVSLPAAAQTYAGGVGMNSPNYTTYRSSVEGRSGGLSETPTMKAEKLARAKALRMEADALLAQDGGTFTPAHEAYIAQKVCEILSPPLKNTGNLPPSRRCAG